MVESGSYAFTTLFGPKGMSFGICISTQMAGEDGMVGGVGLRGRRPFSSDAKAVQVMTRAFNDFVEDKCDRANFRAKIEYYRDLLDPVPK